MNTPLTRATALFDSGPIGLRSVRLDLQLLDEVSFDRDEHGSIVGATVTLAPRLVLGPRVARKLDKALGGRDVRELAEEERAERRRRHLDMLAWRTHVRDNGADSVECLPGTQNPLYPPGLSL